MKKPLIAIAATLMLAGCAESKLNYDGKLRTQHDAEERIEDKLEAENPGKDYEVTITTEEKKKKKKKTAAK